MYSVTFENQKAQAIYNRVLSKTPLADDKKKVREIFDNQAQLDGDPVLSEAEAKQAEEALNYYDRLSKFQIGKYNSYEVDRTLDESYAALTASKLYRVSPSSPELISFLERTAREGLLHPRLIAIARRLNPDLHPEDLRLIIEYNKAPDEKAKAAAFNNISQRIKQLNANKLESYDGIESPWKSRTDKRLKAFYYALEASLNGKGKKMEGHFTRLTLASSIRYLRTLFDHSFLSAGSNRGGKRALLEGICALFFFFTGESALDQLKELLSENRETFKSVLIDALFAFVKTPLGEKAKIEAYRRFCLLSDLATAAGIKISKTKISMLSSAMDHEKEAPLLKTFQDAEDTPEKNDDFHLKGRVIEQVDRLAQLYQRSREIYFSSPTVKSQESLLSAENLLKDYISYAKSFGCSLDEIDEIIQSHGILDANIKYPALGLAEVKARGAVKLSPADLPHEIRTILTEAGIYEDIARDVHSVFFVSQVKEPSAAHLGFHPLGMANAYTKCIWLSLNDSDGKPHNPIDISATIIHEWLHIKWDRENFGERELTRSIPGERNSYLGEAEFMQVYLKKMVSEHADEMQEYLKENTELDDSKEQLKKEGIGLIIELAGSIDITRKTGLLANRPLGYEEKDTSPRSDLPQRSEELDLDIHPVFLLKEETEDRDPMPESLKEVLEETGFSFDVHRPY